MKMSLGVSPYTDELVRYFLLMAPCVFFFFDIFVQVFGLVIGGYVEQLVL